MVEPDWGKTITLLWVKPDWGETHNCWEAWTADQDSEDKIRYLSSALRNRTYWVQSPIVAQQPVGWQPGWLTASFTFIKFVVNVNDFQLQWKQSMFTIEQMFCISPQNGLWLTPYWWCVWGQAHTDREPVWGLSRCFKFSEFNGWRHCVGLRSPRGSLTAACRRLSSL